jgi:hypothetical protein
MSILSQKMMLKACVIFISKPMGWGFCWCQEMATRTHTLTFTHSENPGVTLTPAIPYVEQTLHVNNKTFTLN